LRGPFVVGRHPDRMHRPTEAHIRSHLTADRRGEILMVSRTSRYPTDVFNHIGPSAVLARGPHPCEVQRAGCITASRMHPA